MLYLITMASQSVNANTAFSEFSKNMSICIFTRVLGILSFLLIITSGIFLLLCYWLLTGSKYVEQIILRMTINHDQTSMKNIFDTTIQTISNRINAFTLWNIISSPGIKKEVEIFYQSQTKPQDSSENNSSISDSDSSDSDSEVENNIDDSHSTDDDLTLSSDSDEHVSVNDISTLQTHDTEMNNLDLNDNMEDNIKIENQPKSDNKFKKNIPDIEDVTEQCIAEREKKRETLKFKHLIDLSSDSE